MRTCGCSMTGEMFWWGIGVRMGTGLGWGGEGAPPGGGAKGKEGNALTCWLGFPKEVPPWHRIYMRRQEGNVVRHEQVGVCLWRVSSSRLLAGWAAGRLLHSLSLRSSPGP